MRLTDKKTCFWGQINVLTVIFLPISVLIQSLFLFLSIFPKHLTPSGTPIFFISLILLISILALFIFLSDRCSCVVLKIKKVAPFAFVEVFCNNNFSALFFSLFLLLYIPPITALFLLTTWSFGPPFVLYLLLRRPRKETWWDWSASLGTNVFFSIRENVWFLSPWCISTTPNFIPVYQCSISLCTSNLLPLFLGSPLTALFVS